MRPFTLPLACVATLILSGCASYVTPGRKADLGLFTDHQIRAAYEAKPSARFPASIVAVRVQAPGYSNYHLKRFGGTYGTGRYSVVTAREVEEQSQFDRIMKLPEVGGIIGMNALLLPATLTSELEIRQAAARLQADLIFLYTFETSYFNDDRAKALKVISLGLSPTRKVNVSVTVSVLLMDARTAFLYGAIEATERRTERSNAWVSGETADRSRRDAEKVAFEKIVGELEKVWPSILARYHKL